MAAEKVEFEENLYYDQLDKPDIFHVTVVSNPSAERCNLNGDYEFHICTENFAIFDKAKNKRVYTWPFRYVRRYGKSTTNFQFEAGRKCPSGEGLFSLLTVEGDSEVIFNLIQTRFQLMKQRDRQFRAGSVDETPDLNRSDSQTGPSPTLPARQYENNEFATKPVYQSDTTTGITASTKSAKPAPISGKPTPKSVKPTPKPKPKSIRRPQTQDYGEAAAATNGAANASHINMLIEQNRGEIGAADVDNTYSVVGRDNSTSENTAQYSAVYGQKTAPTYKVGDDVYDEVSVEHKHK